MAGKTTYIAKGYHTVTPHLIVKDAARAIDFYKRAFGATERGRMAGPDGKIMHAEVTIGDSIVMLADEQPQCTARSPQSIGGTSVHLYVYVQDADAVFNQAVAAGARVERPVADQFYGDRSGMLIDPFGHSWGIATHKQDLTREQMEKAAAAAFGKSMQQAGGSQS